MESITLTLDFSNKLDIETVYQLINNPKITSARELQQIGNKLLEFIEQDHIQRATNDEECCVIRFTIEDVHSRTSGLSHEQAVRALKRMERKHDVSVGIDWDTLDYFINEVT